MTPHRMEFQLTAGQLDCFRRAKSSALLYFAQEAAGEHCKLLSLDWDTLQKRDLFWAVIRHQMQVHRLPVEGETITVETWPMPTTRSAFPRATAGYDEQGNLLFRSIALWVLMDTNSRTMLLPNKSGIALDGILRGNELALPSSLMPKEWAHLLTRPVRYSELDRNGHMNNTRYLDWAEDLLPADFHRDHPVKEFTVCYLSEALENQEIALSWQLDDGPILSVDGRRQRTDVSGKSDRVFSVRMVF